MGPAEIAAKCIEDFYGSIGYQIAWETYCAQAIVESKILSRIDVINSGWHHDADVKQTQLCAR